MSQSPGMLSRAKIDDDTLAEFLGQPVPRDVPEPIRRAAYRQAHSVMYVIVGVAFFGFGSAFMATMFPWRIDRDLRLSLGPTAVAYGTVTAVAPTNLTVNHRKVYRYEFQFGIAPGEFIRGECFTSGQSFRVSQHVLIDYRTDDPGLARIQGARLTKVGGGAVFVLLFPSVGIWMVAAGILARIRARRLLERGELTEATILGLATTGARVNGRPVYKIELRLEGTGQTVTVRHYELAIVNMLQQRGVGGMVFVLFDSKKPKRLMLPESLVEEPAQVAN